MSRVCTGWVVTLLSEQIKLSISLINRVACEHYSNYGNHYYTYTYHQNQYINYINATTHHIYTTVCVSARACVRVCPR